SDTVEEKNKALVLDAFDTLFNKRDYASAEKYWSRDYIQHSAHILPGRDGLFNLIKASPPSLRYEHGLIMAGGDFVIVHGGYSNTGLRANWIVADIVRIENGVLAEHWMSSRTKPRKSNPRAEIRCLETSFQARTERFCIGARSSMRLALPLERYDSQSSIICCEWFEQRFATDLETILGPARCLKT